jgi:hypothetical protein
MKENMKKIWLKCRRKSKCGWPSAKCLERKKILSEE